MKIIVKYEQADIIRLIEKDIADNHLKFVAGTVVYEGDAMVTAEVEGTLSVPPAAVATPAAPPVAPTPALSLPTEPEPDMGSILTQSNKNANNTPALYPTRPLMEGESTEWPGSPTPRGR